eukprot:5148388-Lingulodinium_polyedra.AAC.1
MNLLPGRSVAARQNKRADAGSIAQAGVAWPGCLPESWPKCRVALPTQRPQLPAHLQGGGHLQPRCRRAQPRPHGSGGVR